MAPLENKQVRIVCLTLNSFADLIKDVPTFRLIDLPPELWSRICRLAAKSEDLARVNLTTKTRYHMYMKAIQSPVAPKSITLVCKAIREETLPVSYTTHFVFRDPYSAHSGRLLRAWLRSVEPRHCRTLSQHLKTESGLSEVVDHIRATLIDIACETIRLLLSGMKVDSSACTA